MPTISNFYGILIQMYWNDHPPPHFHVRYSGYKATVGIQSLSVLTGGLPRTAERLVLEWVTEHQAELMEDWRLCEIKALPLQIAPLS
ncbi:MAG TPA: DUF4160 domain-containing protein [Acidobacteriaceae bacterium]|jgi:hypothetical protein|nr:DUF4160 domain-containing protein [Acidobacteriaceae bacterium]